MYIFSLHSGGSIYIEQTDTFLKKIKKRMIKEWQIRERTRKEWKIKGKNVKRIKEREFLQN